jgi:type IV pilus assembly protein PilW
MNPCHSNQRKINLNIGKTHSYHFTQQGLTLIELLVAMVIGLLITLAAVAALVVSRQGFIAVDAASQLRDNNRYLQDIIQRLGVQAGFKNVIMFPTLSSSKNIAEATDPLPNVFGINNSSRKKTDTWDAGTSRGSSSLGYGSDILILRSQTSTFNRDSTSSDKTMIDCSGKSPEEKPDSINDNERLTSIFHVGIGNDGDLSLMCSRSNDGTAPYDPQPLISGVENFQVLYGVDGIGPGNTTVPIPTTSADSIPERYLRADQLTIGGNDTATYANWRRVRSIRIGMVLHGPLNSAIDRTSQTYYPLGAAKSSGGGSIGSAFSNSSDPGTVFTPTPDGRIRQAVTFTVHLRNYQDTD